MFTYHQYVRTYLFFFSLSALLCSFSFAFILLTQTAELLLAKITPCHRSLARSQLTNIRGLYLKGPSFKWLLQKQLPKYDMDGNFFLHCLFIQVKVFYSSGSKGQI